MRKLIVIPLFLFFVYSFSQDKAPENLIWEEVIKVDSTSKATLYKRAQRWFVQKCKDSKNVLQLQDSIHGEIYGKAVVTKVVKIKGNVNDWVSALNMQIISQGDVHFSTQILCKDNRYKYKIQIENIEKENKSSNYFYFGKLRLCNKSIDNIVISKIN